jgi:beta-N-acetylhexosaminidase
MPLRDSIYSVCGGTDRVGGGTFGVLAACRIGTVEQKDGNASARRGTKYREEGARHMSGAGAMIHKIDHDAVDLRKHRVQRRDESRAIPRCGPARRNQDAPDANTGGHRALVLLEQFARRATALIPRQFVDHNQDLSISNQRELLVEQHGDAQVNSSVVLRIGALRAEWRRRGEQQTYQRRHAMAIAACLLLSACAQGPRGTVAPARLPGAESVAPNVPLSTGGRRWVESTLASLSLRDKVAQMVMVWVLGDYTSTTDATFDEARRWVSEDHVGGVVMSLGSPIEVAAKVNDLQRASRIPLIVASDLEPGLGRLEGGAFYPYQYTGGSATILPNAMAIGASGSEANAEEAGRITGVEARAIGIHLVFAPVVDVNNNPANPVINTRSFGEDPGTVSRLSAAFVRGLQSAGVAATAKHFPGHGDTDTDSHVALPVVRSDRARLEAVELAPFRASINAGIAGVMTAHIALPSVSHDSIPATLAPAIMSGLLRDTLGFRGLTITDALTMQGIGKGYNAEESSILSVLAGNDILLMPTDVKVAINAVVSAVERGRIPAATIDASVRKLLEWKVRTGAVRRPIVALDSLRVVVGSAENRATSRRIAQEGVTLIRDQQSLVPIRDAAPTVIVTYTTEIDQIAGREFVAEYRRSGRAARNVRVTPATARPQLDSIVRANERVVIHANIRAVEGEGKQVLTPQFSAWLDSIAQVRSVIVVANSNPYIIREVPHVGSYLATFGRGPAIEQAGARALAGLAAIGGRTPVSLPGFYSRGDGISRAVVATAVAAAPARPPAAAPGDMTLPASAAPSWAAKLRDTLKSVIDAAVRDSAFPGALVLVGNKAGIIAQYGAGRIDWSPTAPAPDARTLWDMASLTKVAAMTSSMMQLSERGLVALDAPVQRYLPDWTGPNKDRVTLRQLLTHSSGLPAWRPLYKEAADPASAMRLVYSTPLDTLPGVRMVYSDIGAILLGEVVRAISGERLDSYAARQVFLPLRMTDTRFLPSVADSARTAPTELDPWRQRHLRGEVHDENAFALGGVSAHAGLFSTGADLARLARAYLNGGQLDGARIWSEATIREFTTVQDSTFSGRALGWETPTGTNSAGRLMRRPAFGHTGFTGTSIWIEPAHDLFVILLSNRVNPTRANTKIGAVRQRVADAVMSVTTGGR